MWLRWIVKSDGTVEQFSAPAVADDWGNPETEKWNIETDKFSDTGERFYAFRIGDNSAKAIIHKDGTLEYRVAELALVMKKEDVFPFSK